jgi:hypothetical protein
MSLPPYDYSNFPQDLGQLYDLTWTPENEVGQADQSHGPGSENQLMPQNFTEPVIFFF